MRILHVRKRACGTGWTLEANACVGHCHPDPPHLPPSPVPPSPVPPSPAIPLCRPHSGARIKASRAPPRTPEPVEGRKHTELQTDAYLEELTDTVPEADNATQTDAFLDRPPTPIFVPQKTGADAATQIANGDLFDFDFEVEPVLEVLVGKVLEQGLMEVLEEEELAAMRSHQEYFEQIRNAELVATQRMEAAEARKMEEKQRRVVQERERLAREKVVREKVAAATFSRSYLSGIVSSVFDSLVESGVFYDPVLREVETAFMPWLKTKAAAYLESGVTARGVVKRLVKEAAAAGDAARAAALAHVRAEHAAGLAWKDQQRKVASELADLEMGRAHQLGNFLLRQLSPPLVPPEVVDEVTEELEAAAHAKADAETEAKRAAAAEEAKAGAEARAAAITEKVEELRAAAAEAAGEEGLPEDWAPDAAEVPEPIDAEAAAAAAADAVQPIQPDHVTLDGVLSALIDKGATSVDAIMRMMAVDEAGQMAWFRRYVEPEAPPPPPEPIKGKRR